ncbi:hypothetical protein EJ04DRAFT_524965 [Polyplosphaeria fusca]|uniref:Uncharacterized protein n=1 Tax=Polyplosphaeria fusca TaxID=682080 RepID=A0A9P4V226_9PLEO|nr:hypothetical protein EJ04DRAFT_524965 [Polyplosphaeria fusca]
MVGGLKTWFGTVRANGPTPVSERVVGQGGVVRVTAFLWRPQVKDTKSKVKHKFKIPFAFLTRSLGTASVATGISILTLKLHEPCLGVSAFCECREQTSNKETSCERVSDCQPLSSLRRQNITELNIVEGIHRYKCPNVVPDPLKTRKLVSELPTDRLLV